MAGSPRTSMWGVLCHMAYVRFRFCFTICHCLTCPTHLWRIYQVEVCLFFFSVFVSQLCCCLNKDQALWFGLAWLPVVCENISFHVQLYISIIHCVHLGDIGWTLEEIFHIYMYALQCIILYISSGSMFTTNLFELLFCDEYSLPILHAEKSLLSTTLSSISCEIYEHEHMFSVIPY